MSLLVAAAAFVRRVRSTLYGCRWLFGFGAWPVGRAPFFWARPTFYAESGQIPKITSKLAATMVAGGCLRALPDGGPETGVVPVPVLEVDDPCRGCRPRRCTMGNGQIR